MKVLYERVAGIDVHRDMVKVAIRSPGEKPWTRTTEILEYRTFYGVLQQMASGPDAGGGVTHGRHPCGDGGQRGVYQSRCMRQR